MTYSINLLYCYFRLIFFIGFLFEAFSLSDYNIRKLKTIVIPKVKTCKEDAIKEKNKKERKQQRI